MKPGIRFGEFTDAWEQRKVEDLGNIITGSTPSTSDATNYGGSYLFVSPADIQDNRYVKNTITKLTEKGFKKGRILKEGSTLFVSIGSTIGKVAQIEEPATTNQQINAIEPSEKYNEDFVYSLMKYKAKEIRVLAATQAVPIINKKSFSEVDIMIPLDIQEQEKIGGYFKSIDNLITLHQRKLKKIKNLKSAYLSKMFPKEGERYPRLRFAGFTDAWEQRKLSDVAEIVGGGTPSTLNHEYWDGDIDWYTPAEINNQIFVDSSERKITELGLQKSSAKILPADKTVLFTSRAGIGKMAILRRPGATNQGFQSLVLNDETDPYFIFSMGSMIKESAERAASGSTFAEISGKMLGNLEFMFPNEYEQRIIGEYFQSIDELITLHQREIEKLKQFKQAMLQKMFV
jgi:type I restriction enzyme S subunit